MSENELKEAVKDLDERVEGIEKTLLQIKYVMIGGVGFFILNSLGLIGLLEKLL